MVCAMQGMERNHEKKTACICIGISSTITCIEIPKRDALSILLFTIHSLSLSFITPNCENGIYKMTMAM